MAIIKKDAYFISSTAVNKIHCCIWMDDEKEYKGVFQIAHGDLHILDVHRYGFLNVSTALCAADALETHLGRRRQSFHISHLIHSASPLVQEKCRRKLP